MSSGALILESLSPKHDISSFQCGEQTVDEWFSEKALRTLHLISTHLCFDGAGGLVGFFALRTVIVPVEGMSSKMRSGNSDGFSTGILLCQMGVSVEKQGEGLGKRLLGLAMRFAAESHQRSSVNLFVVDAASEELVKFYEKAGLVRIPNQLRLVMKMTAVAKLVGPGT